MKRPLDQLAEIAQKAVRIGNDLIKNTRPRMVAEKGDRDTYTCATPGGNDVTWNQGLSGGVDR